MSRRSKAEDLVVEVPSVRLSVFGGIRAERRLSDDPRSGAREIPLGGRQERTLLALLVVHRRTSVTGERLVDMLWPGDAPRTAAKVVQVYIGRLRAELGPGAIERRS